MADEITRINMGMVNCYLINNREGFILIDTGMPGTKEKLEEELEKAGCVQGALKLIIITHGDIDHIGNAAYLRSKYGVEIAMHKNDAFLAEQGIMIKGRKSKDFLRSLIMFFLAHSNKFKDILAQYERFKPDMELKDGATLEKYGSAAKIIFIPGHTQGSIGILSTNNDFISGDTLLNRGKPSTAQIIQDEKQLQESIKILKDLNIKTVYPGHGSPFQANALFK